MQWVQFVIAILIGGAFLIVPGYLVCKAFSLKSLCACCVAPIITSALFGVVAIVFGAAGLPSNPFTLIGALLISAYLIYLVHRSFSSKCQTSCLDFSSGLSARAARLPFTWKDLAFAISVLSALVIVFVVFVPSIGKPDAYLSNYDNAFHLSRIKSFAETSNYSSLQGTFYPSVYHCFAALIIFVIGCSVEVAATTTELAFIIFAYAPGTCYLLATLFPKNPRRVLIGCFFCLAIAFFPWRIFIFGPLPPNVCSFCLMPATLALFMRLIAPKEWGAQRGIAAVLFVLAGIALALAQPNTIFFSALILAPYCMYRARAFCMTKFGARKGLALGIIFELVLLLLFIAVWILVMSSPALKPLAEYERQTVFKSTFSALKRALTFQFIVKRPQYYACFVTAFGVFALLRRGSQRWYIASYAILVGVFVVATTVSSPIRGYISGFCYNDCYRIGSAVSIAAIPLIAAGLDGVLDACAWLLAKIKVVSTSKIMPWLSAVVIAAFAILNFYPCGIKQFASWGFDSVRFELNRSYTYTSSEYYSTSEQLFIEEICNIVGDAEVLNDPNDGSVFAYMHNGLNVTFNRYAPLDIYSDNLNILTRGLCNIASDRRVKQAVQELGIKYVLQLDQSGTSKGFNRAGTYYDFAHEDADWAGIDGITDSTPGFKILLSKNDMRLYEIEY